MDYDFVFTQKAKPKGDAVFVVVDGKPDNAGIHNDILKGKDDDASVSMDYVKSTDASEAIQSLFEQP